MNKARDVHVRGFTILEVLVAVVVISIAFTTALVMVSYGLQLKRSAQLHGTAALLAQGKLAELAQTGIVPAQLAAAQGAYGWRSLTPTPMPYAPPEGVINKLDTRDAELFGSFKWQAQARQLETAAGLYEVQLNIFWSEGKYDKSYRLATLLPVGE